MLDGLAKEGFGCVHVTFRPEQEINRLTRTIDRPIKIDPFCRGFSRKFRRRARWRAESVPALDELWRVALHPTQDRRVG